VGPARHDLLNPFNQSWAAGAGALVCFISKSTMLPPGKSDEIPSHSHSFDAGSAWMAFALQAQMLGWHSHGMVGFDMDEAFARLGVPVGHRVEMMAAVGRRGDPAILPDAVRAREAPNERAPVSSFAFEGGFPAR
jgi:nitroreductase